MRKLIAMLGGLAVVAASLLVASPASAHTPIVSATCETLSVGLTNYAGIITGHDAVVTTTYQRYSWTGGSTETAPAEVPPSDNWQANTTDYAGAGHGTDPTNQAFKGTSGDWFYWAATTVTTPAVPDVVNTVTVFVNGVQVDFQSFGTTFSQTYPFADKTVANTWKVVVDAHDLAQYDQTFEGTSEPCVAPPEIVHPTMTITQECGVATVVFTNGTPYAFAGDVRVDNEAASHVDYYGLGDFYQIVNIPANGSITKTYPFAEDSGDHTVAARIGLGAEQDWYIPWQSVTVTSDCLPPVVVNTTCETFSDGGTATNLNANGWVSYDTRSAGHAVYVDGGLHVFTDDATSNAKVSWAHALNIPLSEVGQLSVDYTNNQPGWFAYGPGLNLFVDITGDGVADGTLVYEAVYGQDLWVTNGSAQALKDASEHTGGNGSENHGTIDHYLTTFPDATVVGFAFALGSGVHADGVIHSLNTGCATYSFDFQPVPVTEVAPPSAVDMCGTASDLLTVPEDTAEVDYSVVDGRVDGVGTVTVTAAAQPGYSISENLTTEWSFDFTDAPCPVTIPATIDHVDLCGADNITVTPPADDEFVSYVVERDGATVTVTATAAEGFTLTVDGEVFAPSYTWEFEDSGEACPTPPGLAFTGSDTLIPFGGVAALLLLIGGGALWISRKRSEA